MRTRIALGLALALLGTGLFAAPRPASAAVYQVTSVADTGGTCPVDGPCTLRQAITAANASAGPDRITFAIGSGAQTVSPASPLPAITEQAEIDGTSQPGFAGVPLIELRGSSLIPAGGGLVISGGTGSVIRGLAITGFGYEDLFPAECEGATPPARCDIAGIVIEGGTATTIAGNIIGTTAANGFDRGNMNGVLIRTSTGNRIGGSSAADRNVISANVIDGVRIQNVSAPWGGTWIATNVVEGNYLGTTVNGAEGLGNGWAGVRLVQASKTLIGGTVPASRNVISGQTGRLLRCNPLVNPNPLPSECTTGSSQVIYPADGLRISTNIASGVYVAGDATGANAFDNRILGNWIGSGATGVQPSGTRDELGNKNGIFLAAQYTQVGDGTSAGRNVVSGNRSGGIRINAWNNIVRGNWVGLDAAGNELGNNSYGIRISASDTTIGGPNAGDANLVAFNGIALLSTDDQGSAGVQVMASGTPHTRNRIQRNQIWGNYANPGWDSANPDPAQRSGLGISLKPGANGGIAAPQLGSVTRASWQLTYSGTVTLASTGPYQLELFANQSCDPSGFGEGQDYAGASTLNGSGSVSFSVQVPVPPVPADRWSHFSATITDAQGNTSVFSNCASLPGPAPSPTPTPTPGPAPQGSRLGMPIALRDAAGW